MSRKGYIRLFLFICVSILMVVPACSEDKKQGSPKYRKGKGSALGKPSIEARKEAKKHGTGLVIQKDKQKASAEFIPPAIAETDFIESARRRDPFRPFIEAIVPQKEVREMVQREIKLEEYDIEQLRLIAIITKVGDPRAMVVPPNGVGFILRRGDYVGKPDYIDPGSGAEKIQINWKVHRIHGAGKKEERGIYLVRDDPLTPTPNDVTRFMPLYPDE